MRISHNMKNCILNSRSIRAESLIFPEKSTGNIHRRLLRGLLVSMLPVFFLLQRPAALFSQEKPYSIDLFSSMQTMGESDRISSGDGWGFGGRMSRDLTKKIDLHLDLSYDHMKLQQDTVLLEWDWDYWDERYIDFLLTGASPEEVDSISRALAIDYQNASATLHPRQWMQEVKLAGGIGFSQPFGRSFILNISLDAGVSIFERRLKMQEFWTKEYSWKWSTAAYADNALEIDEKERYEYFLQLLEEKPDIYRSEFDTLNNVEYQVFYRDIDTRISHLAPAKNGSKVFIMPDVSLKWRISEFTDLRLSWRTSYYRDAGKIGELLAFSSNSDKWFPYKTKNQFTLGLNFRY